MRKHPTGGKIAASTLGAMIFFSSSTGAVLAQEITLPLVRDIPPLHGYGTRAIDVVGIRFGESRDEALAILQKTQPEVRPRQTAINLNVSDRRGNTIQTRYDLAASMSWDGSETSESVGLAFTSALTGSRVYAIERTVSYRNGTYGDTAELRAAIFQKYGEPTIIERYDHQNRLEIHYTWEKRPVKRFAEEDVSKRHFAAARPDQINQCLGVSSYRALVGRGYQIAPPGQRKLDFNRDICIGEIRFIIFYGRNPETVSRKAIEAFDFDRAMTDARLLDDTLNRLLQDKANAVQGAGRPKL